MIGRMLHGSALALAIAGGIVLVAMTVLTVVSIVGRALIGIGLGPIPGSYELVELGAAFAVFCFLPWCQLQRGHVTVDLFLQPFSFRVRKTAEVAGNLLTGAAAAVVAWQMWLGLVDKMAFGETTYILGIPVWIGYASAMVGAVLFVLVAFYTAWRALNELRLPATGTPS